MARKERSTQGPWVPAEVQDIVPEVVKDRRALHERPELAMHEDETRAYVRAEAEALGLPVEEVAKGLSVRLLGRGGPGRSVGIRADMDGLPVTETPGLPFRSQNEGWMHACGHDAHMAIALGVLRVLSREADHLTGEVRVLFQPSEEVPPGGALGMIEAGALDGLDSVIGLHVWSPLPVGQVQLNRGVLMGNTDGFRVSLTGSGGHGSAPHATIDTALLAAEIIVNLQQIVSRRVDPLESAVITVGHVEAGTAPNVIPETASLAGTVRSFTPQVRRLLKREIERVIQTTTEMFGAKAEIDYRFGYPAVVNPTSGVPDVVIQVASEVLGRDHVVEAAPSLGGEDFAYFLQKLPGAFFFLGCGNSDTGPHHSPHFGLDEACLPYGVAILTESARRLTARA